LKNNGHQVSRNKRAAYGIRVNKQPAYKQPAYKQPAYKQPAYKQPAYKQPAYKQPAYYRYVQLSKNVSENYKKQPRNENYAAPLPSGWTINRKAV